MDSRHRKRDHCKRRGEAAHERDGGVPVLARRLDDSDDVADEDEQGESRKRETADRVLAARWISRPAGGSRKVRSSAGARSRIYLAYPTEFLLGVLLVASLEMTS